MRCEEIKKNVLKIFEKIEEIKAKYKIEREIKIVGASKTFPPEDIECAFNSGIKIFGENRFQEWQTKALHLKHLPIEWHFIGTIQSNKIRKMVGNFSLIHSVSKLKHLEKFSSTAKELNTTSNLLLEVNIGKESSKSGFLEEELDQALELAEKLSNIRILGLMTIPPYSPDPKISIKYFEKVKTLFENYKKFNSKNVVMKELSMGMSEDFEYAIISGATIVRLGRIIFGERK